jgi:hypothetical protein
MTKKVYKTAQGKSVDLGTIMLQNEHTRAVGNMNVNARGDLLGSGNKVIETKNRQIQRQNNRTTVPTPVPVHTSTSKAKQAKKDGANLPKKDKTPQIDEETTEQVIQNETVADLAIVAQPPVQEVPSAGGLAAAIARAKTIKQEKDKTARELAQSTPGVRKI